MAKASAASLAKRQRQLRDIGADVARQLGWNVADYTGAELTALGGQVILDHALHGDHTDHVRVLARLSLSGTTPDATVSSMHDTATAADDHDRLGHRINEFLLTEFEHEFTISDAAAELNALRPPSRAALARELLGNIGLDPDRAMDTTPMNEGRKPSAGKDPKETTGTASKSAVVHYLDRGKLSADDLRAMAGRPLTNAEVQAKLATLPPSLETAFALRFNAYTYSATDKTIKLFEKWLDWIGTRHGADLHDAHIEIQAPHLEYFHREVTVAGTGGIEHDGKTRKAIPAAGYIATIQIGGRPHRYFLSTGDGGIHEIPQDEPAADWAMRQQEDVFGAGRDNGGRNAAPALRGRVALHAVSQGKRTDLRTWLGPVLQGRYERMRPGPQAESNAASPPANGQALGNGVADTLLDFIPFRRMFVAMANGNWKTALLSGAVDMMAIAVPMMGFGFRWAAGAARGLALGTRPIGRAAAGVGQARASTAGRILPEMRTGIASALRSLGERNGVAHGLRPLDIESMAAALQDTYPHLAHALERVAARTHGAAMRDGWWRLKPQTPGAVDSVGIDTLAPVTARGADDTFLSLLSYGRDFARAYTRIKPSGERTGVVLHADREGWLYASLPVDTLERYRVSDADLLSELGARGPGTDGIITLHGATYARIADDYVQIAHDRASDAARPAWCVLAPPGVRRDVVIHRIFYDKDRAIWRRADRAGLKGGGSGLSADPRRRVHPAGSSNEGARAAQAGPSGTHRASGSSPGDRPASRLKTPPPLPPAAPGLNKLSEFRQLLSTRIAGTPTPARIDGVQELLARMQDHPRGKAILSAMQAYHELTGRAPDIVLREENHALGPRPSLAPPVRTARWNLDLEALSAEPLDSALDELAAVYSNMTGILEGTNPFADTMRRGALHDGRPLLDMEQEAAWARWINEDHAGYTVGPPGSVFTRPRRRTVIDKLRLQLQSARCHGGVDKSTLIHVLRNRTFTEPIALKLDMSGMQMSAIPPLPADVHTLIVNDNPIVDWSHLPRELKTLKAARTGNTSLLLRYLPASLRELDLSNNLLRSIPGQRLPRGLVRLTANNNQLRRMPDKLPDGLQYLSLEDNLISGWPDAPPRGLLELKLRHNLVTELPRNLPPDLEQLDLSCNLLWRIQEGRLPPHLTTLDLEGNEALAQLPKLPDSLVVLCLEKTGLLSLPDDLPRELRQLYAAGLELKRVPENLPRGLTVLGLSNNMLSALPADIVELTECDIYLDENPISGDTLPARAPGHYGPVYHLSAMAPELTAKNSRTMAQAVRHWLGKRESAAAARWEAIETRMEASADDRHAIVPFVRFLDKLRGTALYHYKASRGGIVEWLDELSRPEREPLLKSTLEICQGAGESCEDRAVMTWSQLHKLRVHDDIRLGRYSDRPADALHIMRQLFRQKKLLDIAYRKIAASAGPEVDDVEVYLAYAVKLRKALSLSIGPSDMAYFSASRVTRAELDAALQEVLAAERVEFYQDLVVDDTWNALIKQKLPERYAEAEGRLIEQAGTPLTQRIHNELRMRGVDPDDADGYRNIAPYVWRAMKYDILEPLTRDYLTAQNIPLPEAAANAAASR